MKNKKQLRIVLKKLAYYYFNLSGKANRVEYGIYLTLDILANFWALYFYSKISFDDERIMNLFYCWLVFNFIFIPMNAVSTRRLRHININTGFIFLNFIPIVNVFFRLFLLIKKGDKRL